MLAINILDVVDPKGNCMPRIAAVVLLLVVPHSAHAYVLHRFGLGIPWSLPFTVGRVCVGGALSVAIVRRVDAWELLSVAALFCLGDYFAPILLTSCIPFYVPLRHAQRIYKAVLARY